MEIIYLLVMLAFLSFLVLLTPKARKEEEEIVPLDLSESNRLIAEIGLIVSKESLDNNNGLGFNGEMMNQQQHCSTTSSHDTGDIL